MSFPDADSFFMLKIPLFPPSIKFLRFLLLPRPDFYLPFLLLTCDSSFTQFQLSLQPCDFLLEIPPHRLRFLFTYCRLKQSPCPKFLQHSSVFTLSTPVLISQSDLFSTPLNEVLHEKISKTRKIPRK